jgi:cell division protein FtsA
VLTGGTAGLQGVNDAAAHTLRMPVRIGVPRGLSGLSDSLGAPAYSSPVGLVLWGLKKSNGEDFLDTRRSGGSNPKGGAITKSFKGWLRAFLP